MMARRYSIAEARHDLAKIVHKLEGEGRIELTRRGEAVAVMLSVGEYRRLVEGKRDFWEAYEEFRRRADLSRLGIVPEEIFE
ncbi:MAG: type II toxin-antitoxin system Phd/YefM family antitoxin, partial [Rubrobacter sp.]|nr:type II toxin-antitoxin system Phd/YefM family antitoxin [Rubrobacter sp.]